MSRVAKEPVILPSKVELNLSESAIIVTGPRGKLVQHYNKLVKIFIDENDSTKVNFKPQFDHPDAWAHAGTARALLNNMIKGVTEGFTKTLELVGVGYRAQVNGQQVTLSLGFSHPVEYKLPNSVTAEIPNNTTIKLISSDKQLLGQVASEIIAYRPPEPYKGKGIKYAGQTIIRKDAKKK
jgi:large subunit ribosomal protein L6